MENEQVKRGFTSNPKSGTKAFLYELNHSTEEAPQVQPLYRDEIARVMPYIKFGAGINNDEKPYMIKEDMLNITGKAKTDGLFHCVCYTLNEDKTASIEKPFLLMLEAKLDVDFADLKERAKVLLQALCYLKLLLNPNENKGIKMTDGTISHELPAVIVLGSKLNCGAIPTSALVKLYPPDKTYIYSYTTPSKAYEDIRNQGILDILINNDDINKAFILRDLENGLYDLCSDILHFAVGADVTQDVDDKNITQAFQRFDIYVLHRKTKKDPVTGENVQIDIPPELKRKAFLSLILSDDSKITYIESRSARGKTVFKEQIQVDFAGDIIEVNRRQLDTFKVLYSMKDYSLEEKNIITAVADRLIKEDSRRFKGDYYTPDIWVDEAYKIIDNNLGQDWRDRYLVWDCAWGTGNLTRSHFRYGTDSNLFCSTLRGEDIEIANDAGYNPNATKFQYDFLNDDVIELEEFKMTLDEAFTLKRAGNNEGASLKFTEALDKLHSTKLYKCAPDLIKGLLGDGVPRKNLLFIINPPYATGTDMSNLYASETKAKTGVAENLVNRVMGLDNISNRNLYMQFIWRITRIAEIFSTKITLGIFSPSSIFTYVENAKIVKKLEDIAGFYKGFVIQGSQFQGVSPSWGISFALFHHKKVGYTKSIDLSVMKVNDNMEAYAERTKTFTCLGLDSKEASKHNIIGWMSEPLPARGAKTKDTIYVSSGLKPAINKKTGEYSIGNSAYVDKFLGSMLNAGSKIEENNKSRSLCSMMQNNSKAVNCTEDNFERVIQTFALRSIIKPNWADCKDDLMRPNCNTSKDREWIGNCLIVSLFDGSSNQTSLRGAEFNGKSYNINNQFFWLSRDSMYNLASGKLVPNVHNIDIVNDLNTYAKNESFVFRFLKTVKLSQEAQDVLTKATDILIKTMPMRKQFGEENPHYNINTWDAGWYQIKAVADKYIPQDLEEMDILMEQLHKVMEPKIYEYGFLYK